MSYCEESAPSGEPRAFNFGPTQGAACRQHGTGRAATLQLLRKVAAIVLPNQKLTAVLIADNPGSSVITASTWKPG